MVGMSPSIQVTTGVTHRSGGGMLGALKRGFLGGESFFQNLFTATGPNAQVLLAPQLCGSMIAHQLDGTHELFIQGSSYVAAPESVNIDTKWQGFKAFFSGESLFFLRASGQGPVLVNAFGAIEQLELDGETIVDTGHLVAFTSGVEYTIDKAGGGWIQSFLSGEGLVMRLRGRGRVYLQSRNPKQYGTAVGRLLPPRER
jgi:uncharacterized protein (TIGR00266 family)